MPLLTRTAPARRVRCSFRQVETLEDAYSTELNKLLDELLEKFAEGKLEQSELPTEVIVVRARPAPRRRWRGVTHPHMPLPRPDAAIKGRGQGSGEQFARQSSRPHPCVGARL